MYFSNKLLLELVKFLGIYRIENNRGMPILIEGKRDKKVLVELGFLGPRESLNRGWSLEKRVIRLV